nr:group II intron reverse transcriptase/maturase [Pseudovibrio sp. Tun.PSC04-5.I4]
MQHKLAKWAQDERTRRFDRLLRLIADRTWLTEAARVALASSGAKTPGVDGVDRDRFRQNEEELLATLGRSLLDGTYAPAPTRRVYIPKGNGKLRPLGIPTLTDRIVQRAMLMVMEPIWESDFSPYSYGFRPQRSVHHAIRAVLMQTTDGRNTKGRWVIEGDLASYFDTVHHRKLLSCVRKRIRDKRFIALLWRLLKAGHIDKGLFCAASKGVPQGGVLSPLLSNIMLNEFDRWMDEKFLGKAARNKRRGWNESVRKASPVAVRENRCRRPAVSYCRYADDFVVIVKGTKAQALAVREECRAFLEGDLALTLNMEKTHVTHVNDGFVFLGHRIIRKRGPRGVMRPVTTIPREKTSGFKHRLVKALSGDHNTPHTDMIKRLNRQLMGWANFYQFTDYTSKVFQHVDTVVFWKMAHWLGRKYRSRISRLMRKWFARPYGLKAKTWMVHSMTKEGVRVSSILYRLTNHQRGQFRWKTPRSNPYLREKNEAPFYETHYRGLVLAF